MKETFWSIGPWASLRSCGLYSHWDSLLALPEKPRLDPTLASAHLQRQQHLQQQQQQQLPPPPLRTEFEELRRRKLLPTTLLLLLLLATLSLLNTDDVEMNLTSDPETSLNQFKPFFVLLFVISILSGHSFARQRNQFIKTFLSRIHTGRITMLVLAVLVIKNVFLVHRRLSTPRNLP